MRLAAVDLGAESGRVIVGRLDGSRLGFDEVCRFPNVPARMGRTLDLGGFILNLVPVTLGNIVGGALLVAAMYWLAYLRHEPRPGEPEHDSPQRRIEECLK